MLLGYFTEEAYDKLLHDIQHNTENYSSRTSGFLHISETMTILKCHQWM